ncbi:MAG: thiamine ABC transporter substrate-binding protein [Acidimicrobiia bacterium]
MASLVLAAVACTTSTGPAGTPPAATGRVEMLTLISHDSFAGGVTEETFAAFTEETGIAVEVVAAGDTGAMVNQAILTKDNPLADVLFGVDDTFLSRALDEELFVSYQAPRLSEVPDHLVLDPQHRVTPIDFGDVCVNYDKEAFTELPPPSTLSDLTDPAYRGMLVVEHPATSSPGLAFLLATVASFGEDGWAGYWEDLAGNDIEVTSGWDQAYYSVFSGGSGEGTRPLVVSYASSPPAEVIFADPPVEEAPTGVLTDGCYRQVELAGVLAGTEAPEAAGRLIDFMLSVEFQEQIPLTWFVFPANSQAELPPEFVEHTVIPDQPAGVDPQAIEANRERWIDEWTTIVLP